MSDSMEQQSPIRAAQVGLNVACVEEDPALGGTCLRIAESLREAALAVDGRSIQS